ncbi:sugar transferase [Litorivita sp. NS0012-18]|uniref:sugar transferase n=1 Tax=Litorivita sp. NS0012-18 TaxID=3127655 RepID=UPI0031099C54
MRGQQARQRKGAAQAPRDVGVPAVLVLGASGKMGGMVMRAWRAAPPRGFRAVFAARAAALAAGAGHVGAGGDGAGQDGAGHEGAGHEGAGHDGTGRDGHRPAPLSAPAPDVISLEDLEAQIAAADAPRFDVVIALWGVTSGAAEALAANTDLALRAVEIARMVGARRVFHASSSAVYAPAPQLLTETAPCAPLGAYGAAKLAMEAAIGQVAQADPDGPQQVILRFANLAGGDSLFAAMERAKAAARAGGAGRTGGKAQITLDRFADGQGPRRSYIAPHDLARALEVLSTAPLEGAQAGMQAGAPLVINCAAGGAISMEDIARAAGVDVAWRPAPEGAAQCVALDVRQLAQYAPDLAAARSGADIAAQVEADRARAAPPPRAAARPAAEPRPDPASDPTPEPERDPAREPARALAPPMPASKRAMDLFWALVLAVLLGPLILAVALAVLLLDGRPVLYIAPRMRTLDHEFGLWKFRTMRADPADSGVSGGDKSHRITRSGAFLRRYRLDELPQLWNIARGDISFVGPRPPLRRYVEQFPALYAQVLRARPGVTGLATLAFHAREEALLAPCKTAQETEEVYTRRCIPAKARLDLIYQARRSNCWDHWLILATVLRRLPLRGPRAR